MELTLGFSPCPNDTFIFDALVNGKIDTGGLTFKPVLEDVQTLNRWALEGKLDISKISYGVLPLVMENYSLLNSGGALGKGVGPLLISRHKIENLGKNIPDLTIAIPGQNTTANLLFSYAMPLANKKIFLIFNEIEDAVLTGKADAGVIIHESRFTYQDRGLVKLMDLGEYWEQQTNSPIPLGGIVTRKSMELKLKIQLNNLIRKSLEYSFENYPKISSYVSSHSQEMSEDVMRKHIELYVNNFSLDLGDEGKEAVKTFLKVYEKQQNASIDTSNLFLELV